MCRRFVIGVMIAPLALATPANSDNWSGFYFGGTVGLGRMGGEQNGSENDRSTTISQFYGWSDWPVYQEYVTVYEGTRTFSSSYQGSDRGSAGVSSGVVLGLNQQLGRFVIGGEINVDWLDYTTEINYGYKASDTQTHKVSESTDGGPFTVIQDDTFTATYNSNFSVAFNIDWKATLMGRAGVLVSDDLLAYGLIGYARAGFSNAPFDTRNGVSFGGGLDWAMDDRWSLRAEYRRTEFEGWNNELRDSESYSVDGYQSTSTSTFRSSFDASTDEIKIGVTYRFGRF